MALREEERRQKEAAASSKGMKKKEYKRGDDEDEELFLCSEPFEPSYKNNHLTEWTSTLKASEMWEKIEEAVAEVDLGETERDEEKRKFTIKNEEKGFAIKIKFFWFEEEG